MQRFENRRIIITGAGSGIGQGTVLRLLAEGGRVHALDIDGAGLAATVDLAGQTGSRCGISTRGVSRSRQKPFSCRPGGDPLAP